MDARQYLSSRGWKGDGHGLGSTQSGIKRPLLVSKKVDVLGVGLNKHKAVSDQWWLRAFDQGLKDFGTGKQSSLAQVKEQGHFKGGLYGHFVPGERLEGTIKDTDASTSTQEVSAESDESSSESSSESDSESAQNVASRSKSQGVKGGESSDATARTLESRKRKRADEGLKSSSKKTKTLSGKGADDKDREDTTTVLSKEQLRLHVKSCLREAYRRGIIPAGSKEIKKGLCPQDGVRHPSLSRSDPIRIVLDHISDKHKFNPDWTDKQTKLARRQAKRDLKRYGRRVFSKTSFPANLGMEDRMQKKAAKKLAAKAGNSQEDHATAQQQQPKDKKKHRKAHTGDVGTLNDTDEYAGSGEMDRDRRRRKHEKAAKAKGLTVAEYLKKKDAKRESKAKSRKESIKTQAGMNTPVTSGETDTEETSGRLATKIATKRRD